MNTEINMTATQARYERERTILTRRQVARLDPVRRAQAVARHYAAHAALALEILNMVEGMEQYDIKPEIGEPTARLLLEQLQRAHLADLGVPLEWPAEDAGLDEDRELWEQVARRAFAVAASVVLPFEQPQTPPGCGDCRCYHVCPLEANEEELLALKARVAAALKFANDTTATRLEVVCRMVAALQGGAQ